jgi:hypothetical protein
MRRDIRKVQAIFHQEDKILRNGYDRAFHAGQEFEDGLSGQTRQVR